MDLAPIQEALTALVSACLAAVIAYAGAWLRDHAARLRLNSALGRAAGLAVTQIGIDKIAVAAAGRAAAVGAGYVQQAIPGTLRQLAVPPDRVRLMVEAEIGKLLAQAVPR
jgi:hypothetical protein